MFGRITSRIVIWFLNTARFSIEDRAVLTNHLLQKLAALPVRDIITLNDEGGLLINDRPLSVEEVVSLRESATQLSRNYIRKILREQMAFEAIKVGVHNSISNDTNFFAKAALWNQAKENEILQNIVRLLKADSDE